MELEVSVSDIPREQPTRRECHLYACRYGADLLEDFNGDEPTGRLRSRVWLDGYREDRPDDPA